MRRVAVYARCSTSDQSVNLQLDGLREYAQVRGFTVVKEYTDAGVSGAKTRRPALDALLNDAHRRRFDAVLVYKLDRLGRSLSHLIHLVDQLGSLGVDLVSLGDAGLDTTGPSGRLLFHVMGAVAEFERDLIRDRTRAGLQAARRRGKQLGRPRACDARQQQRIKRLRQSGHSLRAIAQLVGVGTATVSRVLAVASS